MFGGLYYGFTYFGGSGLGAGVAPILGQVWYGQPPYAGYQVTDGAPVPPTNPHDRGLMHHVYGNVDAPPVRERKPEARRLAASVSIELEGSVTLGIERVLGRDIVAVGEIPVEGTAALVRVARMPVFRPPVAKPRFEAPVAKPRYILPVETVWDLTAEASLEITGAAKLGCVRLVREEDDITAIATLLLPQPDDEEAAIIASILYARSNTATRGSGRTHHARRS